MNRFIANSRRGPRFAAGALAIAALLGGSPATAIPGLVLDKVRLHNGGGYDSDAKTGLMCGIFRLFLIEGEDPDGTIVNPTGNVGETLDIPLSVGTHTFTMLGSGPGPETPWVLRAWFNGDPAEVVTTLDAPVAGRSFGDVSAGITTFSLQLNVGDRVRACSVGKDGIKDAIGHFTITVAALPTATIASPAAGATLAVGEVVPASYDCESSLGIAACEGTIPEQAYVDTSEPGEKVFTVEATDTLGGKSTTSITYLVACDQAAGASPGACAARCETTHDCAAPLTCDASRHCVDPPPLVADFSGCSAAPARPSREGGPEARTTGVCAVALLAALAAERRRRAAKRGRGGVRVERDTVAS